MTPGAAEASLGDVINDLITQHNLLVARTNTCMLQSAALAISAGASPLVKNTAPILATVAGILIRKAIGNMPALAGTLATAKSAAWSFYINSAGTLSVSAKTTDASTHDAALALVPAPAAGLVLVGILVLDNATGSNFVGNTTALDAGSLTATYYSVCGDVLLASDAASKLVGTLASR